MFNTHSDRKNRTRRTALGRQHEITTTHLNCEALWTMYKHFPLANERPGNGRGGGGAAAEVIPGTAPTPAATVAGCPTPSAAACKEKNENKTTIVDYNCL